MEDREKEMQRWADAAQQAAQMEKEIRSQVAKDTIQHHCHGADGVRDDEVFGEVYCLYCVRVQSIREENSAPEV